MTSDLSAVFEGKRGGLFGNNNQKGKEATKKATAKAKTVGRFTAHPFAKNAKRMGHPGFCAGEE